MSSASSIRIHIQGSTICKHPSSGVITQHIKYITRFKGFRATLKNFLHSKRLCSLRQLT